MNRESLENISRLQSLEAENKHLKALLSKYAERKSVGIQKDSSFEKKVELLTQKGMSFDNTVIEILGFVGLEVGVDRVSVFVKNNKESGSVNKYQWVNTGIQQYHSSDLIIEDYENPCLKGNVAVGRIDCDVFKRSLVQKFEIFQVKSLLLIPFEFPDVYAGLLVFETCDFSREWYDFEIFELKQKLKVISTCLILNWEQEKAREEYRLRKLLSDISHLIVKETQSEILSEVLEKVSVVLGFDSVFLIDGDGKNDESSIISFYKKDESGFFLSPEDINKTDFRKNNFERFQILDLIRNGIHCSLEGEGILLSIPFEDRQLWMLINIKQPGMMVEARLNDFLVGFIELVALMIKKKEYESDAKAQLTAIQKEANVVKGKTILLDKIFQYCPVGVIVVEAYKISQVSETVRNIFDLDSKNFLGKAFISFFENDHLKADFFKDVDIKQTSLVEVQFKKANGFARDIRLMGIKNGEEGDCVVFVMDVSVEGVFRQQIASFKRQIVDITNHSGRGIAIFTQRGQLRYVNHSFSEITGCDLDELSGADINNILSNELWMIIKDKINSSIKTKEFRCVSFKDKNSLSKKCDVLLIPYVVSNEYEYYVELCDQSDIDFLNNTLEKLSLQHNYTRKYVSDLVVKLDKNYRVEEANPAALILLNDNGSEKVIGNCWTDLKIWNSIISQKWIDNFNKVISENVSVVELNTEDKVQNFSIQWSLLFFMDERNNDSGFYLFGNNTSEIERIQYQLKQAVDKAEESDKLKDSFLGNISHELRTPLNAIVGFSALLKGNELEEQVRDEYVDVILKNSDVLLNLINNIIDVAKIDSKNILVEKEPVDLDKLMESLYYEFESKVEIEHKGKVKLYLSKASVASYTFVSDPIRLRQVMMNLINNAIKFTVKGFIEFGYVIHEDGVKLFVRDTGIGVLKEKQKIIFEPFCKEDEMHSQFLGGTGIGLTISKKIVDALGGKIGIVSEKGQGAEFFVIHPLENKEVKGSEKKIFLYSGPVVPENYHWTNKLILLVDENSSEHLKTRKFFDKTGLTLMSARTAVGASKLMQNRNDVDLVLMDLNFPDSNGYDLVSVLKSQNKDIPVIAYSSETLEKEEDFFKDKGFDASLAKPAKKEEMLKALSLFLQCDF